MAESLVSIITPTFNAEKYLSETIDSVLSQSYSNWELLITDDCSTDSTISVVKSYAKADNRVKLFVLPKNSGAGVARNNSIKMAKGKFVAFLDADDFWHPLKLNKQIAFMERGNLNFSFSSYYIVDINGNRASKFIMALPKVTYSNMLLNNYIGCLTAIYNADKLGRVEMPTFRKRQDWGLWLKLLKKTNYALSISEPLAYYRKGNNSLSSNKFNLIKSNFYFYKTHLGFSFIKSIFMISLFLFAHFKYKFFYTKQILV